MNTIEKIYTNYDGLLEEFSEEVIQSRYAVFYEEIEEFAKSLGIREKIQISESLLSHAVLDYFTDISRLKHFHQAKHINSLKVISYETYWLLRRKPIQILVEDVYGDIGCDGISERKVRLFPDCQISDGRRKTGDFKSGDEKRLSELSRFAVLLPEIPQLRCGNARDDADGLQSGCSRGG